MIYLIGGTKGGIGKSTVACNFAAALAHLGRDVCLVDMDFQGHSTSWVQTRREAVEQARKLGVLLPSIHCAQAISDPKQPNRSVTPLLQSYAERYGDLVLDAGGRNSPELRSALRMCNVVMMPFLASAFDLWTAEDMAELIGVAREYNPRLDAMCFVNRASNNWTSQKAGKAREFLGRFSSYYRCAETLVHERDAFSSTISDGIAVMEYGARGNKAADELYALISEVGVAA